MGRDSRQSARRNCALKDLAVESFGTNNSMRSRRKQMGCRKSRTP
jgi:hypothetical protein